MSRTRPAADRELAPRIDRDPTAGPALFVAPSRPREATPPEPDAPSATWKRWYLSVPAKFLISVLVAALWLGLGVVVSSAWQQDLATSIGPVLAWVVIILLAYLPGFLVAFLATSLFLDRQPPLVVRNPTTGVSIVIAARNESAGIADTIRYAVAAHYDGPVTVVLADNGSTDDTCAVARATAAELDIDLRIIHESTPASPMR